MRGFPNHDAASWPTAPGCCAPPCAGGRTADRFDDGAVTRCEAVAVRSGGLSASLRRPEGGLWLGPFEKSGGAVQVRRRFRIDNGVGVRLPHGSRRLRFQNRRSNDGCGRRRSWRRTLSVARHSPESERE